MSANLIVYSMAAHAERPHLERAAARASLAAAATASRPHRVSTVGSWLSRALVSRHPLPVAVRQRIPLAPAAATEATSGAS